jgi:predicted enzyme related to lactoylglutathione lyase
MRVESLTFDARDPSALGRFWADALGWELRGPDEEGDVEVVSPDGDPYPGLLFCPVDEPEAGQERLHLDLRSTSLDDQAALVERLIGLGATPADVGQSDEAQFVVLADPEGNDFCVLEPRPWYGDTGPINGIVLGAHDNQALADFWTAASGWDQAASDDRVTMLRRPDGAGPWFFVVTRPTMPRSDAKARAHLDVRPIGEDQQEVVDRLLALGASHADIGQHDDPATTWVVLTDPEGNELCVLSTHATPD